MYILAKSIARARRKKNKRKSGAFDPATLNSLSKDPEKGRVIIEENKKKNKNKYLLYIIYFTRKQKKK